MSTAPSAIESTNELTVTQQIHPLKTDSALLLLAPADAATVCIEPAVIAHGSRTRRRFIDPLHFDLLSSLPCNQLSAFPSEANRALLRCALLAAASMHIEEAVSTSRLYAVGGLGNPAHTNLPPDNRSCYGYSNSVTGSVQYIVFGFVKKEPMNSLAP